MSKEEIENMKLDILNLHHMLGKKTSISKNAIKNALKYIDQLESDKQKLIEKLEKYTNNTKKEKLPYFKTVADMIKYKGYAEGRIETCEEILSIVKGENHE